MTTFDSVWNFHQELRSQISIFYFLINWNQTKKLSDEISVLSVENEKIVKLKEKLENDVGLLNEAIDIQKDQTRRYSVKLERFESKELPESEEISDLKQKIENLTDENRQLNEKISNFDSSAMSIASELPRRNVGAQRQMSSCRKSKHCRTPTSKSAALSTTSAAITPPCL